MNSSVVIMGDGGSFARLLVETGGMEALSRVVVAAGGIGPFAKVVGWYQLLDRIQLDIRLDTVESYYWWLSNSL